MRCVALVAVLAGLLGPGAFAPAVSADLYKWVDDRGAIHYSSMQPPAQANIGNFAAAAQPRTVVRGDALRDARAAATALSHAHSASSSLPGSPSLIDRATSDSIAKRLARAQIDAK